MVFHKPDTTSKRLRSCWKRAVNAKQGVVQSAHPLAAAWSNAVMMLDGAQEYERPEDPADIAEWRVNIGAEGATDLVILDWFAEKLDKFASNNLIIADESIQAILHEWKQRMPCDPTKLA